LCRSFSTGVAQDGGRARDERAKPRPSSSNKAPNQSEEQQTQNAVAKAKMPDHGLATNFSSYYQSGKEKHQTPVKHPRGEIPNPDSVQYILLLTDDAVVCHVRRQEWNSASASHL
jgi:hypothetical protein